MASKRKTKSNIITAACRRFQHLPSQTLARYIMNTEGDMWADGEGNEGKTLQRIRSAVRVRRGKNGALMRDAISDKSLFTEKIELPISWKENVPDFHLDAGLWLVMADTHIPMHEPMPIKKAFEVGKVDGVDGIVFLGDIFDCGALAYWRQRKRDFNKELAAFIDFIDYTRQEFPDTQIVYKPSNHERRLPDYLLSNAPYAAESPLAAMETLIDFEHRNIEFLDYNQKVMAGELSMIHGHEVKHLSKAVNAARGLFLKAHSNALCAHSHQTSYHPATDINGNNIGCWSIGCMCDLRPDWNPLCNQWNWGFATVEVEKRGGFNVNNFRVMSDGKIR